MKLGQLLITSVTDKISQGQQYHLKEGNVDYTGADIFNFIIRHRKIAV